MQRAILFIILFIQLFFSALESKAQILVPEEVPFLSEPALMRNRNNKLWVVHFVRMYQGYYIYSLASKQGNNWQNYPNFTLAAAGGKIPKFSDIIVFNNKIFVSGTFGIPLSNKNSIAVYDIALGSWSAPFEFFINGGIPSVHAMAIADNRLFAGGGFQKANSVECLNIAQISKANTIGQVKIKLNNGIAGIVTGLASDSTEKTLYIGGNYKKAFGKITSGFVTFRPADSVLIGFTTAFFHVYFVKNTGKNIVIWADKDSTKNRKLMIYKNGKLEDLPQPDSILNLTNVFEYNGLLHASGSMTLAGNRVNGIVRLSINNEHIYKKFTRIEMAESLESTIYVHGLFFNPFTTNNELFRLARINEEFNRFAGRVYNDVNGNNKLDIGELKIGGRNVKIAPWNILIPVDKNGIFTFILPASKPVVLNLTPQGFENSLSSSYNFKIKADTFTERLVDLPVRFQKANYTDIQVNLTAATGWKTRLDTSEVYRITVTNNGLVASSPDINLNFSSKIIKVTPVPAPDVINPGKITWNNINLLPGEEKIFTIKMVAPSTDFPQSSMVDFSTTVSNIADDNSSNNSDSLHQEATAGIENVSKFQYPTAQNGDNFAWLNPGTEALEYIIRFTNNTYDTLQNIIVRDTVSLPDFVTYIQETGSSHSFSRNVYTNPNLPNKVIVVYTFQNINLPPINGNSEVSSSAGYIGFKLGLSPILTSGTEITNRAWVYMDGATPLLTNTVNAKVAINSMKNIDNSKNIVYPNPFCNELNFAIQAGNSELNLYTIDGKLIYNQTITQDHYKINTDKLGAGVYIYTLKSVNQSTYRGIIQKNTF